MKHRKTATIISYKEMRELRKNSKEVYRKAIDSNDNEGSAALVPDTPTL